MIMTNMTEMIMPAIDIHILMIPIFRAFSISPLSAAMLDITENETKMKINEHHGIMLNSLRAPSHYLNQCWNIVNRILVETNFSEISIEILIFSFKKMPLKVSSANGGHFVSASMI